MEGMVFLLRVFLGAVLRVFFPAAFAEMKDAARDTAEDARPQPELKTRLRERIRARWGRAGTAGALALCALLLAGCGTRTVYVESGEPVRLRQNVKRVRIWVPDANGDPVPSRMTLPEGWYVLPVPDAGKPETPPEAERPAEEVVFGVAAPNVLSTVPAVPALAPAGRSANL